MRRIKTLDIVVEPHNVCVPCSREDEGVERGLDIAKVLGENAIDVATPVLDVAADTAGEHDVRVTLNEDFEVEQVADGRVVQDEDAFDDDD
jgi:hypothetical protein